MIQGRAVLAAFVLVLAIGQAGTAQCIGGDDGFDVGCCMGPVTPTLPVFPAVTMTASWAEMAKCFPSNVNTVTVSLAPPTMVLCDYALVQVSVAFPAGETINGVLVAKYVRTFNLLPVGSGQVWRFLLNGDLACAPIAASVPCTTPLPRCSFIPGQTVHFDGHLDYQCNPGSTLPFRASLSLTHHSGCISHATWSCVPIGGLLAHTESSYHLVGPAPFVWGAAGPTPAGPLIADSARSSFLQVVPSLVYGCTTEQKIGPGGVMLGGPGAPGCVPAVCNLGPVCSTAACTAANTCYEDVGVQFTTCCAGAIWGPSMTVPIGGTPVQATGMIAVRLGQWGVVAGGAYPTNVNLRTYFGVISYQPPQPCPPLNAPIHAATGVATSNMNGQPFNLAPTCLPPAAASTVFFDLQNNLPLNSAGPLTPGYGCLAASDVVWSFNLP
jgi:hypothetical protein